MSNTKRIKTLEALRAIAFVAVVIHHSGLKSVMNLGGGVWAVSLFFVLSGFVSVFSEYDKENITPSIKNNVIYAINKIKRFYPLYILCTLSLVVFDFTGEQTEKIGIVLHKVATNALLIQEWLPFRVRTINTPAWYLCPLVFSYLVFPYIIRKMKNDYSVRKSCIHILILIMIQLLVGIIGFNLPRPEYFEKMLYEYDIVYWFVYRFPLSRFIDIALGYETAYIFINCKKTIKKATLKEIAILVLTVITIYICGKTAPIKVFKATIPTVNYDRWWTYALLFSPISCITIYVYGKEQGIVSKFLVNKITMYLAKISPYGFMIHSVVNNYLGGIISKFFKISELFMFNYGYIIYLTIGFILTIVCCEIWILLRKKLRINNRAGIKKPVNQT